MSSSFVISGSNSAELFEFTKKILDQMVRFIQMSIIDTFHNPRALRGNHYGFARLL